MGGITHKGSGNSRANGRPHYGLMLFLAFGAALVGAMVLHKLRERRIFNLLVEEKNRQLVSLQMLLQKEREYTKEMKTKAEETKAKIYSLRNQKMELDRRVSEMQSTIDSLKDELKTMESAVEEKQNDIKLLRKRDLNSGNETPQVIALTATLKQKEAEIEDLKRHLKSPVGVLTETGNVKHKVKTEQQHETTPYYKFGDDSMKVESGNETKSNPSMEEDDRGKVDDRSKEKGESSFRLDMAEGVESLGGIARKESVDGQMGNEYSKQAGISKMDVEENHANATQTTDATGEQEHESSFTAQPSKLKNSSQELRVAHKGGKKLDMDNDSRISRLSGRIGHKGKKWRILNRNRLLKRHTNSELDGVTRGQGRKFSKDYKDVARGSEDEAVSAENEEKIAATDTVERKGMGLKKVGFLEHQSFEENEVMKHRQFNAETNHQVEGENVMSRNQDNSLESEVQVNEETHIKQNSNSRSYRKLENKAEITTANKEGRNEAGSKQETETEVGHSDLTGDLMSDSEYKNGYKEEIDESEF